MADIIFFKKYIPLISLDGRGYNFRIFIIIYTLYIILMIFSSLIFLAAAFLVLVICHKVL